MWGVSRPHLRLLQNLEGSTTFGNKHNLAVWQSFAFFRNNNLRKGSGWYASESPVIPNMTGGSGGGLHTKPVARGVFP
jgi:hypothetical protein